MVLNRLKPNPSQVATVGPQVACRVSLFTQCPQSSGSLSALVVQSTLSCFARVESEGQSTSFIGGHSTSGDTVKPPYSRNGKNFCYICSSKELAKSQFKT